MVWQYAHSMRNNFSLLLSLTRDIQRAFHYLPITASNSLKTRINQLQDKYKYHKSKSKHEKPLYHHLPLAGYWQTKTKKLNQNHKMFYISTVRCISSTNTHSHIN